MTTPTFTCNACGTTGSADWMRTHDCAHNQYVAEFGGRCEDYPCCGHTDGDGCATRESHTAAYWQRLHDEMGDERYEEYLEALDRQEAGF